MYSIKFSQTAEEKFYRLEKQMQERAILVLERIKLRPFHFVKKKQGTPYFILRIGDYRAILDIKENDSIIFVIEIGHRKKIYEN